ncbi:uncharacterized protein LOC110737056 [Chenopodium quinoa]|uniref:uncharacterized protein LOC110737056 n=1 Tax=Chenopodium quinoa TaxID=63459 RepID=UPI000B782AD0|nr:uncharacterized protein LOC110737056 [Chenopodium quinoa]
MDASFEKFPNIYYTCEAVIASDHLREMIKAYKSTTRVSMNISDKSLIVCIGESSWELYEEADGIRGMPPNMMHCGWFQMPHHKSLKKASFLATGLVLCLVTDPPKHIMLRFNLRELGDLTFISKAGYLAFNATVSDYDTLRSSLLASFPRSW